MSRSSCRTSPSPLRPQPHPAPPRHLPTFLSQPDAATALSNANADREPPCLTHSHSLSSPLSLSPFSFSFSFSLLPQAESSDRLAGRLVRLHVRSFVDLRSRPPRPLLSAWCLSLDDLGGLVVGVAVVLVVLSTLADGPPPARKGNQRIAIPRLGRAGAAAGGLSLRARS